MPAFRPALEVETRLRFADPDEALQALPFLRACLDRKLVWHTHIHGEALYRLGSLLRLAGGHAPGGQDRHLLGWKGPDRGVFANIREEIDEEITCGIADSAILAKLGGRPAAGSPAEVEMELDRLGHRRFMTFAGHSLLGVYKPLGLHLKLMACEALRWPLLLEIEKTAGDMSEAAVAEKEIESFIRKSGLLDRVVREEPPDLLLKTKP